MSGKATKSPPNAGAIRRRLRHLIGDGGCGTLVGGASPPQLYHYPGTMVPCVLANLLEAMASDIDRLGGWALDPFVGSGTSLAEAMVLGRPFLGVDINPMAVLISKVRAGPFHLTEFELAAERVAVRAEMDRGGRRKVASPCVSKWFRADVALTLSRLQRSIMREHNCVVRRFLWVVLAETARRSSNARLSTVKLHMRPAVEADRVIDSIGLFRISARRAIEGLTVFAARLSGASLLRRERYVGHVRLICANFLEPKPLELAKDCSLVITSPPYGDNRSTVPYGQASFLPLQWVPPDELRMHTGADAPKNAYETDVDSLGGRPSLSARRLQAATSCSPTLQTTLDALEGQPRDRAVRVGSHAADLNMAIGSLAQLSPVGAIQIWTVGDRTVGGRRVPLTRIVEEMQIAQGLQVVCRITRSLPEQRRAPSRSPLAPHMGHETTLVFVRNTQTCVSRPARIGAVEGMVSGWGTPLGEAR